MKFRVRMKTPDVLHYALEEMDEDTREEAKAVADLWFEYEECLTVQIDTQKKTCVVVKR